MAILKDLCLEVKILVNNSPLREYEDKEAAPTEDGFGDEIPKCRRYVEVVEDAEFAVQLHVTPANDYLDNANKSIWFILDLDGQENFENRVLTQDTSQFLIKGKDEVGDEGIVIRRFRFTTVTAVDDDDTERVNKHKKTASNLGLLRARNPLAAAVPAGDIHFWDFDYMDLVEVPLAIFYFKYRSKAVLQEELVIPRSPEPPLQPVDLDGLPFREVLRLARENVEILPLHEIRRLAQLRLLSSRIRSKLLAIYDKYAKTPQEVSNILEVPVKRESGRDQMSHRPRKFVKMGYGREAVDLTGDD